MYELSGRARFERFRSLLAGGFAIVLLALAAAPAASAQGLITNLSPSSVPAGSPGFDLLVTAVGFGSNPTVVWNGTSLATTANGNVLTAKVTPDLLAAPGPVPIVVTSIVFNLVHTPAVTFTVTGPVITSLSPPGVLAGSTTFTLTINGAGFILYNGEPPSVTFNGNLVSATYINSTQLQATIISAWVATAGVVPVYVTDVDPSFATSPAFPFTIGLPLQLVSQSMPAGQEGALYDFTFQTANGVPPLFFTASGLPGTLSLNPATGEVKGYPTSGTYHVSLVVTDAALETVTRQFTLSVAPVVVPPLAFTTGSLPAGQVGVPYKTDVNATGGAPPYTFGLAGGLTAPGGTLPAGLTILSDGAITGTPTAAGTSKFNLQVTDSAGTVVTQAFSLTIAPPPLTIANGALSNAPAGAPLAIVFTATGGFPGYAFSAGPGIPTGMTFSSSGTLSGTPTTPGTYRFTVTVQDNSGATASKAFSIVILPPLVAILTAALPNGQVGVAYGVQFYAANGQPPYTWTATGTPPGITMSSTGSLSGTPTADGAFSVAVTVTDSTPATNGAAPGQAKQTYTLTVAPAPLVITTTSLPTGVAGTAYSATLAATGGDVPYTWTVAGLPSGITASAGGALSGTPASAGSSTVSATVTDSKGVTASQRFNLTVTPAPISITTTSLPGGAVQTPYSVTLTAAGGAGSNKWSATGLPAGLTISAGGTISGTPTVAGTSAVAVTVTDAAGTVAVATFTLTIAPAPLAIVLTPIPLGVAGAPYSVTLAATGGVLPYKWSATGLASGFTISPGGTISGTLPAPGSFTAAVTVTDAAGTQAKQSFTFSFAAAPLAIATPALPAGMVGTAYSATLAATGGAGSNAWSATGLPAGLAMSAGGVISGTPTAPGAPSVQVKVTDSAGAVAVQTYTLTIAPAPLAVTTPSLPAGVAGTAYTAALTAAGGAGSNKWSATGLPAGLTISAGGTISGTPTAPGVSVVVVTVTDSAGTVAVATFKLTVQLPATPPLNISGLPPAANPGTQPGIQVGLASAYPLPVTVTLTLVFTPDSGADDPAVQFSTGGRVVVIQIPAGATTLMGNVALQTGTVEGTIVITAQLSAAGQDITPSPAPQQTVRIAAAAPAISSVTAARNSTGFTVTVIGFATPRQVTQANFQFAAAASANLQTASLAIPVTSLFSAWYASAAAAPFGSQFSFVQPFNVTGSLQGITSVTVTLTNAQGTSAAVTANLQ